MPLAECGVCPKPCNCSTSEYLAARAASRSRSFAPGDKTPSQVMDDALVAANAAYECAQKALSYLGVCQMSTNYAFSYAKEAHEHLERVKTLLETK